MLHSSGRLQDHGGETYLHRVGRGPVAARGRRVDGVRGDAPRHARRVLLDVQFFARTNKFSARSSRLFLQISSILLISFSHATALYCILTGFVSEKYLLLASPTNFVLFAFSRFSNFFNVSCPFSCLV